MNFDKVIRRFVGELEQQGIRYALIGGFAMAMRGVQRATMDLDFIVMLDDMDKADSLLVGCGYQREFHSENVSHYIAADREWGRIDILHAFRGPSLGMLQRADLITVHEGLKMRVARTEDIIGLKIQALVNNPGRARTDWTDISLLLEAARRQGQGIDWELLADYLNIFHLESRLPELRAVYEQTDTDG